MPFNHVVLVEPEIPQNTGNIARTCAVTSTALHLVRPLGFDITDKHLKRAGLDYWHLLELHYYDSIDEVLQTLPGPFFFASTRAHHHYAQQQYPIGSVLVFGKETAGLPQQLLDTHHQQAVRIPMGTSVRSLNLSNSVAIILYEALRQQNFLDMR